jgi:hypothetical protein
MIGLRRIDPAEFERCVAVVAQRIEALAKRLGVLEAGRLDLESTLSALPPSSRGHVGAMLDGIALRATDDDRTMAVAARYVRALADDVWASADHAPREGGGRSPRLGALAT